MAKRPGVGRRHGVGPIVAVDSLSVRVGLKLRLEGTPARRMDWRPGPALPSVCVELDYHPVVRLRARVGAPHARAKSAVQLILPCAWNKATWKAQCCAFVFSKRTNRRKPVFFPFYSRYCLACYTVDVLLCVFMTVWDVYGCFVVVFTCVCCDDDTGVKNEKNVHDGDEGMCMTICERKRENE